MAYCPSCSKRACDVLAEALDEHEGSDLLGRGRRVACSSSSCSMCRSASLRERFSCSSRASSSASPRGLVQRLAPFHLLHQEHGRHGGVVLGVDRRAAQLAQVGRALERILQALVGLVDAHRPLHGHALGRRALRRETVRMGLALQFLPARVDRGAVLREPLGQAEQLEVAGLQVEVHRCDKKTAGMGCEGGLLLDWRGRQTLKLSPQPQRSRSLGLLNRKPSFRPSRTKSSCVPSM